MGQTNEKLAEAVFAELLSLRYPVYANEGGLNIKICGDAKAPTADRSPSDSANLAIRFGNAITRNFEEATRKNNKSIPMQSR